MGGGKIGLTGQAVEDFIGSVIAADFGKQAMKMFFRKLRSELDVSVSDAVIRDKMRAELEAAVKALNLACSFFPLPLRERTQNLALSGAHAELSA